MSALGSVENDSLNPISQGQLFFSSVSSLLSSLMESTDSVFRRVQLMKEDADGNFKYYDSKETITDPVTNEKKIIPKKVCVLSYIEDVKTGDLYLDEPEYIIAVKCALCALGIPFYAFAKVLWHAIKTPLQINAIGIDAICRALQHLTSDAPYDAAADLKQRMNQMSEVLYAGLFEIIKAPLFALGCELASICGVFKPYHGRKFEALVEKAWQNDASYKIDFRNIPARSGEDCWTAFKMDCWTAFVKDFKDTPPFYLAHCFQVRGNVNDPRVVILNRSHL